MSGTGGSSSTAGAAGATSTEARAGGPSHEARNLQWLLANFVDEVPGVRSVAVVSSDGLLLLSSQPDPVPPHPSADPSQVSDVRMDLAAVVSGLASLTMGAARLMDGGKVRQTTVAMDDGMLFVMSISDGSLLGVHATAECDLSVIAYHMALFVGRAGHVLTPALRGELRQALEGGR
ncbi:roadblock/LC7 domain-containing protein [Actinacidiphila yanglinensis]|nr:roadblock/LC7 domain-containing protein [Actinacidiphila yanglinensis]